MTDLLANLLDLAVEIQQIPAPTFDESRRAEFVRQKFVAGGLNDVHIDAAGNVLGRLPGTDKALPLIVSAHLDTVFPLETDLSATRTPDRISGPGIGDNSMGVAALFGILWALQAEKFSPKGDIWFVANTCEEGLGDLRGMREVVDHFGEKVKAYLVIEGMSYRHVYHRGTGVRRYKISAHCEGGHSWSDFGNPSAVHELSRLIARISTLEVPVSPRTTFNVGRISGGTSINTIAAEAWMELDLRSESAAALASLTHRVEELVRAAGKPGVRFDLEQIGERPAGEIPPGHPLIRLAQSILKSQGVEPVLTIGSTDANIPLSRGYPALVLGLTSGHGAHTVHEYAETAPVERGLAHLVDFVKEVWKI